MKLLVFNFFSLDIFRAYNFIFHRSVHTSSKGTTIVEDKACLCFAYVVDSKMESHNLAENDKE